MKKFLLWLLGLILIGLLSLLCFKQKANDIHNEILANLNTAFLNHDIKEIKSDIIGNGLYMTRILILDGTAPSKELKERAEEIALSIDGVIRVQNNLQIIKKQIPKKEIHSSPIEVVEIKEPKVIPKIEIIDVITPKTTQKIDPIKPKESKTMKKDEKKLAIFCQKEFKKIVSKNRILFEYAKTDIKSSSYKLLDKIADIAKKCPNASISIEGHTDWDGSKKSNMILSTKRAKSVMNYLIKKGIPENRLKAIGHGESKPIGNNRTVEGQKMNRRIEFIVKGVK